MFKYRFQKALDFKYVIEERKKEDLNNKRRELEDKQQDKKSIELRIIESILEYEEKKLGRLKVNELILYENHIANIKREKVEIENEIIKCEKEIEKMESELIELKREIKTYEKLKEKKFQEYSLEENLKEQKFIDELSNGIFNRR